MHNGQPLHPMPESVTRTALPKTISATVEIVVATATAWIHLIGTSRGARRVCERTMALLESTMTWFDADDWPQYGWGSSPASDST